MRRALELAELGRGKVSPNPLVGCVIVHNNQIIGEGYHQKYGGPHAEVNALNSVSKIELLPESDVYVTLEPCSHHGKTPPCADLLVEKNVKRVIYARRDPFPKVDGTGHQKMEEAGIAVEAGLLSDEAAIQNKRFLTFHEKKRPYVILKWAQTTDGFIARDNHDSKWISNEDSRRLVHKWRAEEDAILVGKNTAIHDDPALTVRDWQGENPIRVLLDTNLEVASTSQILADNAASTIVFNSSKTNAEGSTRWVKSDMRPQSILNSLHEEQIQSMIVEGGSAVLKSFIRENCWDEARVFTSPQRFDRGLEAPQIEGILLEESAINDDALKIYQNKNG